MVVQRKSDAQGRGSFFIEQDGKYVAEMVFSEAGTNLTVFHTEVDPSLKGQGVATRLLNETIAYARAKHLKVIPLCPYVSAQFKRHPENYKDIWNQSWHA